MTTRRALIAGAICIGALGALAVLHGIRRDSIRFAMYVVRPIPKSVNHIRTESNDLFGLMTEPEVRISFSAGSRDMAQIVANGGFVGASTDSINWFESRGDRGWWSATPLNDGSSLFFRKGRRGEEYLRIDKTGTNAFYLLWGI
ncbi:hypothetical protein GC207_08465 [bacterium]|nr:hypothetical protein [bacterium]